MTERDAATSALAGPLVNARATSAGPAPCAPMPGSRQDGPREQPPGLADRARMRRADDRAHAGQAALADELLAPLRDEARATCCQSGFPSESARSWMSATPSFEVLTRQKMPAPFAPAGRDERLERVAAEIRVDGHRVGERRAGRRAAPRYAARIRAAPSSRCLRASRRRRRSGRPCARTRRRLSSAAIPGGPSASKKASCGFTPTAYAATASITPRQKRAQASAAFATAEGRLAARARPAELGHRVEPDAEAGSACRSTASASRSPNAVTLDRRPRLEVLHHRRQASERSGSETTRGPHRAAPLEASECCRSATSSRAPLFTACLS